MDARERAVSSARKLLAELVKGQHVEIRRVEIVGRDLAKLVESLGRPPSGQELEELLDEHPQVSELCAATSLLDELVYRYLEAPSHGIEERAGRASLLAQLQATTLRDE